MERKCKSCREPISNRSKTGRCRRCAMRQTVTAVNKRRQESPWFNGGRSTVRNMQPIEAAWVGAMIEGEGSLFLRKPDPRHRTVRPSATISCLSTEVETTATVLRLVGDGRINPQAPTPPGHKTGWCWALNKKRSLVDLLPQIIPYLTSKRDMAESIHAMLLEDLGRFSTSQNGERGSRSLQR